MNVFKFCEVCGVEFCVPHWREGTAKYCSRKCSDLAKISKPNTACTYCGKEFHMRASQKARYNRTLGFFCSQECNARNRTEAYLGDKNPNSKQRNFDQDGYKLFSPAASHILGPKKTKLHLAVACEAVGMDKIPKGYHVHHRDCNIMNNVPENLAILTVSDHKWLHKQFGNATLWAFMNGKIDLDSLVSWSDDCDRARRILPISVVIQSKADIIGVVKGGELLENPEEDNQQPSLGGNILEGSETSGRVVVNYFTDSNSTTSALHPSG